MVDKEAETATALQRPGQLSGRFSNISIFDAEQADRRIEATVVEWQRFHAYPGMDRKILDVWDGHIRKIDPCHEQILAVPKQGPPYDARPAPKIDDVRAAGQACREMGPVPVHRLAAIARNVTALVRLIFEAKLLPELGPEAWAWSAMS